MSTSLHYQADLFCHDPHHAPHDHELVIDNFAGGGGASIGISKAIKRSVDIAINHDVEALAMHQANHPDTRHYCENILDVDPVKLCAGRPVGMAWFSPDCTHHSKAKGGKPRKTELRALAWIVVRWAAKVRPRVIFLENVEEFQDWGPLKDGQPIKARKGETFRRWIEQLQALGYVVDWRVLSAHDYGAPTTRKRLFLVARCDGQPIVWPKPTHGRGHGLKPYRTAAECLDFSIPCPSIFLSKEEARTMGIIRPLAGNTLRRIAKGLKRYVIDHPKPFIIAYYSQEAFRGQGVDEPLSAFMERHADGERMKHKDLLSAFCVKYYGCGDGQGVDEPMHTITTKDRFGLVQVHGQDYQIVDIGLRMLQPRELARAQGFPDDYALPGTKTRQVKCIGNSVSPPPAEALVRANYRAAKVSMGATA